MREHTGRSALLAAIAIGSVAVIASCTSLLGDFNEPVGGEGGGGAGPSSSHTATSSRASSTHSASSTHASSSHSGTGTSGGGGGAGGAGGGPQTCSTPADCPDPSNPCLIAVCDVEGICALGNADAGVPAPDPTPGDCKAAVCDGNGGTQPVSDDTDNSDGNECTIDKCTGGAPTHTPEHANKPCGTDQRCDGNGSCVDCLDPFDCPGDGACIANVCQAPSCSDGVQNNGESDTDCGGMANMCPRCSIGKDCNVDFDCSSDICQQGSCRPAACGNMVKDSTETDVDCGGPCGTCGLGHTCALPSDCTSDTCTTGVCVPPASCSDMAKDGTESDVDCGGVCFPCAAGLMCGGDVDCVSGNCSGGLCQP